VSRSVLL